MTSIQSPPHEHAHKVRKMRRVRRESRSGKQKKRAKRQLGVFSAWTTVALAVVILVNPVQMFASEWIASNEQYRWLFEGGFPRIVGLLVLALGFGLVYASWRKNMIHTESKWASMGCEWCEEPELKRLHRRAFHKTIGAVTGLPYRFYVCGECGWKGTKLDDNRRHLL